jgi:hypothetical protein
LGVLPSSTIIIIKKIVFDNNNNHNNNNNLIGLSAGFYQGRGHSSDGKRAPSQHTVVILLSPRGPKPAQNHPGMPETSPPRGTPHRSVPS